MAVLSMSKQEFTRLDVLLRVQSGPRSTTRALGNGGILLCMSRAV
jgi:hypothetical protein